MGEGEQRSERVTDLVLQGVAEQQRVKQQRVVEDGDDLHVLCKTATDESPPPHRSAFSSSTEDGVPMEHAPLMSAGVSLQKGRGSGAMLSTASLLNTSPKTAMTRPLFWVWSRKLAGLWHRTGTMRPLEGGAGLGSTLMGCGTHLKTLEDPLVNPWHSLFLRRSAARISTISSCGGRVGHTFTHI